MADRSYSASGEAYTQHGNIYHRRQISHFDQDGHVVFTGPNANSSSCVGVGHPGCVETIDCIIWATGYEYNFPFLAPDLVTVGNRGVRPLFQHLLHVDHPTLVSNSVWMM